MIGNDNVGKTSLFFRFTEDIWEDAFYPTIGLDFKMKSLIINGKKVKLQVWDTIGQERFRNTLTSHYNRANGIMLIYDITNLESFINLISWLIDIKKYTPKNVYKI